MDKVKGYKVLNSELKYQGIVLNVFLDKVKFPNGKVFLREVVKHRGAVGIVPLNLKNEVILVRQYRHPVSEELLEIPAGLLDKGESPLDCVRREVEEETGFTCSQIIEMARFYTTPGCSDETFYLYLGLNAQAGERRLEEDEIIEVETYPIKKAIELINQGKIKDGKTIIGLLMAYNYLQQKEEIRDE